MNRRQTGLYLFPILIAALFPACGGENGTVRQEDRALGQYERAMFDAVNRYRDSVGLRRMKWDEEIAGIARSHSRNMAEGDYSLGHTGAHERTILVAESIPWQSISENVAYSTERTDIIGFLLGRWLESAGHRTNIRGDYDLTGIGTAESEDGKIFFTQIFVLRE